MAPTLAARTAAPAIRWRRPVPHRLPVGGGVGAAELAGDPRPLLHRRAEQEEADLSRILFPRYHQLVVTRLLQDAVLERRARSEVPDSALRRLRQDELHCLDRPLLLRAARRQGPESLRLGAGGLRPQRDRHPAAGSPGVVRRKKGVVASITSDDGSKSAELAEALSGDKKVVVCTIQTFPFALQAVRDLAATEASALP